MPNALRSAFPVLEHAEYLNAGSVGPVPRAAAEAATAELERELTEGRGGSAQFARSGQLGDELRAEVAQLMGCQPAELALTGATTDGVNAVLGGLDLQAGDEILTSDEEHPGLLAPLGRLRKVRGVEVRIAPFDQLGDGVGSRTRLIACSHVSWLTGRVADSAALAASGVPVLLDGAQGLGAVPVDVRELGCDFYAASGQKWLCGPVGSGYLFVSAARVADLTPATPGYGTVEEPTRALEFDLRDGARRFDAALSPTPHVIWALSALRTLAADGIGPVHQRAGALAERLAEALAERGATVAPRGSSTLVSWEAVDPEREVRRLGEEGFVLRHLPGTPWVRASVGAWSDEDRLDALAAAATSGS